MKKLTLSPRTVEMLIGILATAMIAIGLLLYAMQEPDRLVQAAQLQTLTDLDEAMSLYAENCSVCHGLAGEGIGATPALDRDALRLSDPDSLTKIISRGLFNTAMPAWNKTDGGPLSDYQINELVTLILQGDWQAVQDRVVNLGLAPRVPFTTQPDPLILEQVAALPDGASLVQAVNLYSSQCVACHGADGLGTSLAPALNDPLIRQKTPDELQRTILNGVPGTLMSSWQAVLAPEDVDALVLLVTRWDQVPTGAIPAPDTPLAVTEESLALGSELYSANCTRCHGPDGQGTQRAPALNVRSFLTDTSDAAMQQIITLGVTGTAMPAWGDRLGDAEIQAIVGYLRSWEPTAPEVATPLRGPWWRTAANTNTASASAPQMPSGGVQGQGAGGGTGAGSQTGGGQAGTPPPWSQQNAVLPWWQTLDWRAWLLLGSLLLAGSTTVALAAVSLRKINRTPDSIR